VARALRSRLHGLRVRQSRRFGSISYHTASNRAPTRPKSGGPIHRRICKYSNLPNLKPSYHLLAVFWSLVTHVRFQKNIHQGFSRYVMLFCLFFLQILHNEIKTLYVIRFTQCVWYKLILFILILQTVIYRNKAWRECADFVSHHGLNHLAW